MNSRGSLSGVTIDPNLVTIKRLSQLLAGVTIDTNGCWKHSNLHHTGYTYARIKQTKHGIHRIMKTVATGKEIPVTLVCDHLCRNRACVNPKHIEIVTQKVNAKRGDTGIFAINLSANMTECRRGHPRNAENTYFWNNRRYCWPCRSLVNGRKASLSTD